MGTQTMKCPCPHPKTWYFQLVHHESRPGLQTKLHHTLNQVRVQGSVEGAQLFLHWVQKKGNQIPHPVYKTNVGRAPFVKSPTTDFIILLQCKMNPSSLPLRHNIPVCLTLHVFVTNVKVAYIRTSKKYLHVVTPVS